MTWSLPLLRIVGIDVRIHAIFFIYIAVELGRSLAGSGFDRSGRDQLLLVAMSLGCLFVIVLLHELGHCFACRRTGGEAEEILMWPLGGLAFCRPPYRPRAHALTAAGGVVVNVIIFILLAPALYLLTQRATVALPNPLGTTEFVLSERPWWLLSLITFHRLNLAVLLFNLLPILPLDGGRVCQAMLWARHGYVPSMRRAVGVGYGVALVLGIVGAIIGHWPIIAVALFSGMTGYLAIKQMEWTEQVMGPDEREAGGGGEEENEEAYEPPPEESSAAVGSRPRAEDAAELDRILAKIARSGIETLSRQEEQTLRRETEQKRGE